MNIFKKFVLSGVTAVTIVAMPLTAYAGFFPADRATYTCVNGNQCEGADHVVFNSFTNNPVVGDERPFFAGSLNGANVQDRIKVKDGDVIVLRSYVHNNADPNKIGQQAAIAKNVKMKVLVPSAKQKDHNLVSFISAANANPGTVNDTMSLYGDNEFTLNYVSGSSMFTHKADGTNEISEKLNDTIVGSNGTYLGDIHGCFQYSGYVTLKVKVNMPTKPPVTPAYSCNAFNITADINRTVKVSTFATTATNGAVFKNAVVDWGDGSTQLTDTNIVGKSHQYAKDGTYTITSTPRFTVNGQEVTASSPNCVKQVTFKGDTPPTVTTPPVTPEVPGKLVNTGPGSIAALFGATTAIGAMAHRWMLGRRLNG